MESDGHPAQQPFPIYDQNRGLNSENSNDKNDDSGFDIGDFGDFGFNNIDGLDGLDSINDFFDDNEPAPSSAAAPEPPVVQEQATQASVKPAPETARGQYSPGPNRNSGI